MAYKEPKPILRQETWLELQTTLIKNITNSHIFQNCLNCMNWKFDQDICGKHGMKPPTEIIVYSCPDYTDDNDIPF